MTDNSFGFGFVLGFLTATLLTATYAIYLRDRGRDDCEKQLPRHQSCIQIWVAPEAKESKT